MHNHQCRYCGERYICHEPADECFRQEITCNECLFNYEFKHFLLLVFLLVVAILATLCLFDEYQKHKEKPAFAAPVFTVTQRNTTGEKYYVYAKSSNRQWKYR